MGAELPQALSDLIPKALGDIIRKNHELVELRLAAPEEIHALEKTIASPHDVKDVIENWRLICLWEKKTNWVQMMPLGNSTKNSCPWITSRIITLDLKQHVVLTSNGSIYKLGTSGRGEPPPAHLIRVCAALHLWGSGHFLCAQEFLD